MPDLRPIGFREHKLVARLDSGRRIMLGEASRPDLKTAGMEHVIDGVYVEQEVLFFVRPEHMRQVGTWLRTRYA